jgi:hypothetical protein
MEINEKVVRDLRKKLDLEITKREAEVVEHWKGEVEAVYRKRPQSMASLQVDLKALIDRMANRVAMLSRMVKDG